MSKLGVAVGLAATAVAGVCAGVLLVGRDPAPKGPSIAEVETLRKEVRRLEDRLRALESRRPGSEERPFAPPLPAGDEEAAAEGRGPHDGSVPGEDPWGEEDRGERGARGDRWRGPGGEARGEGEGPGEGRGGREDRRREWRDMQERTRKEFIDALGLNEAQLQRIDQAYGQARTDRTALRDQVREGRIRTLDAAPQLRDIQAQLERSLQETLYPDQWKKYQELQAQRRELQQAGGGFGGGGFGWSRDPLAPVPPEGDGPRRR